MPRGGFCVGAEIWAGWLVKDGLADISTFVLEPVGGMDGELIDCICGTQETSSVKIKIDINSFCKYILKFLINGV